MFLIIAGHVSKVNDGTQHVWFTHLLYLMTFVDNTSSGVTCSPE